MKATSPLTFLLAPGKITLFPFSVCLQGPWYITGPYDPLYINKPDTSNHSTQ